MKPKYFKYLLLIFFTASPNLLFGQFYTIGDDPPFIKWNQIKSKNYTIIFPEKIDSLAREYLFTLERQRASVMEPLMIDPKPIQIVLHPYTTFSNGSVAWAPKRVDLITTPNPYNGTPQSWIEQLTTHESRHIGQIEHFTKGVYNVLYYLLGEQITGLGVGLYPSNFFLEGDAVTTETELTQSGRGRQAEFLMYPRAIYLKGDYRNWDRLRFGSFRDYTPNEYAFGYLLNTAVRYNTSNYYFPGLYYKFLVKNWYNPNLIFLSYKSYAGMKREEYLQESQILMTNIWTRDLEKRGKFTTQEEISNKRERLYTNYENGIYISDPKSKFYNSVISIKKGMEYSSNLIFTDSTGKDHIIRPFSNNTSPLNIASDGKIYWTEGIYNNSSTLENFSVLRSFDIYTKKVKTHHKRTKYFNPSPSETADSIAVVEYPIEGSSYLVILSSKSGKIIDRIEAPNKGQLKETAFIGRDIYCTIILNKGLALYCYSEGKWREVIPQQNMSINSIKAGDNGLYFSSDLDGILNIYYYELEHNILYRLTNSVFGASYPYIDRNSQYLYYSTYDDKGYRLTKTHLDSLQWKHSYFTEPHKHPIEEMMSTQAKQATSIIKKDSIDVNNTSIYPSKRYSKIGHLFRFHSWAPIYYNVDNIMNMSYEKFYDLAAVGLTLYSQNTLGTANTMVGYSYHNGFHSGHLNFRYSGIKPNIELSFDINDRFSYRSDMVKTADNKYKESIYDKTGTPFIKTKLLIYYPLYLSKGGWNKGLIPQLSWTFSNDDYYSYEKEKYLFKHQIQYGARYYQVLPIAKSQIFPRYGFGISAMGASALGSGGNFGDLVYLYGYGYLPGINRQQGFKITATYQKQFITNKNYYLSPFTSLPRGYDPSLRPTMNYFKVTADYAIPIYLGDKSLSWFLYFKRLQIIPFGEYARDVDHNRVVNNYYSYGTDVLLDFVIFRFNLPISIGVRYARTGYQEGNRNHFKFLFSIKI